MEILNRYTNPNKSSFLILILPYLGIISIDHILSPITTIPNTLLILFYILLIEQLFSKLLNPISDKMIFNSIINSFIICIFYGSIIIEKTNKIIVKLVIVPSINQWILIIVTFILGIIIQIWIFKNHIEVIRIIKTFFIIFFFVMIIYKVNQNKHFFKIKTKEITNIGTNIYKKERPIILIISDGYVSPNEFYNYYKDSSVFSFSNSLKNSGWIVNNCSMSEEITTIHSLSSLFNYNQLVLNKKEVSSTFWGQALIKSKLTNNLKNKGVLINNYGIVDLDTTKRFTPIYYYYPTSEIGQFFDKSMINVKYLYNDSGLIKKQFEHNKFILEIFPTIVNKKSKEKSFYYIHLLMPHDPYSYSNQFSTSKNVYPDKYFEYWKFTNNKLEKLLKELTKEGNYRIILTGDHGYGNIGGNIKAENTFTAYYGFDSLSVNKIKSVQDLGLLINGAF